MFSAILALALAVTPAPAPTPQRLPTITVAAPRATLTLQVARTQDQHERGLMQYRSLPDHTGMIFVFDTDGPEDFWMKDTLIPLDMLFVGADGRVRSIAANVPTVALDTPNSDIPLESGVGKYVIELAAGEAARDGITVGVRLNGVDALK
jgi:uncharacterized membrane protein (UPF0127 family)